MFGIGSPYGQTGVRWYPDLDGEEFDGTDPKESPRHLKLVPAAWLVWQRCAARRAQQIYYARQIGGLEAATALPIGGINPSTAEFEPSTVPRNVIRSATNTLTAKVIKNRPEPMYLPVGGDQRLHRRVRRLNRFTSGLFHRTNFYQRRHLAVRDAGLQGGGHLLIQDDGPRLSVQYIYPWELCVDPIDARAGDPRSLYIIRYIDKGELAARYPRKARAIERAPALNETFYPVSDVFAVANRCTVFEAFHLPSLAGQTRDGRHTVCLLDETLKDEPYHYPDFPIARWMKDPPAAGWWGIGLGDELSGFQYELDGMSERISYAHRIVGGQMWFLPEGSEIYDTDFNDDIGVIIRHTPGLAPSPVNPQPVHEQTYQYMKDLAPEAFQYSGISMMSATSEKPPGVTAAEAIQTLNDMQSDRFIGFERDDEESCNQAARLMLRAVRRIAKKYGDFEVLSAGRGTGESLRWMRDVNVPEDSYVVRAWAISLLPKTPAAKIQRVLELGSNGYFDKPTVLRYLGLPDTELEETLMLAAREVADAQIGAMLEHPEPWKDSAYLPPTEHQDCAYALQRAQAFYNHVQVEAIEKGTINTRAVRARLRMLDQYMSIAKGIDDQAKEEAAQIQAEAMLAAQQKAAMAGAAAGGRPQLPPGPAPGGPQAPQSPIQPAEPVPPPPAV